MLSNGVMAAEVLNCEYSKADISSGPNAPMNIGGKEKIEFDGKSFKAFRPDGSYVMTPPLTEKKDGMIFLDDKTKVFAASLDKSNFAVSDRIGKTTEQWAKCSVNQDIKDHQESDAEIKIIESMTSSDLKRYFLNEKHAFTTNCLVWEDVTMITGRNPAMIIAGSVNMGSNPKWNGREYSFLFNGGSMVARFTPSEKRHKLLIQAGDKFYGCGPSEIDKRFE